MDDKDGQLLKRIAQKDAEAFHMLYQQYGLEILRYLMSRLDGRQQAEDVLQNLMLIVWQRAASYNGSGSVRGWMYGIARNLCANAVKASPFVESMLDETHVSLRLSPEDEVEEQIKRDRINAMIKEIPLVERQVIEAVYYRGLGIDETAAFLSIPANTVKTRLYRARKRMRAMLLEYENG